MRYWDKKAKIKHIRFLLMECISAIINTLEINTDEYIVLVVGKQVPTDKKINASSDIQCVKKRYTGRSKSIKMKKDSKIGDYGDQRYVLLGDLGKYEEVISNFLWIIMLFLITADTFTGYLVGHIPFQCRAFFVQLVVFVLIIAISIYKMLKIRKEQIEPGFEYTLLKVLDIALVAVLLSTMIYGHYFYFVLLIPIVSICVTRGFSISLPYLGIGFAVQALIFFLSKTDLGIMREYEANRYNPAFSMLLVIVYITFLLFLRMLGVFYRQFRQSEQDNQNLVAQLGIKYAQLEQARIEKQEQFDKLKEVNLQLEDSNKKLTSSLAEFFTLQQISQAISSIFDMDELLQFVNDVIIGVMGVSTSNIALYSGGGERLKVQVSNILNKRDLAILTDNINSPALKDAIDKGRTIINNAVDADKYDFTRGRNVRSLLCAPLKVKDKTHGFVLIEHSIPDAFDADNVRLLEIITQQVSIAIDNARLYEQLQEYANTDGLTQVYNRIYFQNRLKEELDHAEQQGYEVSVILYDIDDFKLFNDSYGHLFGDIVLKSIARAVKESVRKDDVVARFGGEEFIILLPHTGTERAFEKAEELRKQIASLTIADNNVTASVTVSMGVSTFPTLANTDASLISGADNALYEAKRSGKNCVKIASSVKK